MRVCGQFKDRASDPLPPLYLYRWIFTRAQLWRLQTGNILLYWRKSYLLHSHKIMVWENCLRLIDNTASVFVSFYMQYHGNLLMNCYLYKRRPSDPLPPPYLYIVKIEIFHPILTPSLRPHKIDSTSSCANTFLKFWKNYTNRKVTHFCFLSLFSWFSILQASVYVLSYLF